MKTQERDSTDPCSNGRWVKLVVDDRNSPRSSSDTLTSVIDRNLNLSISYKKTRQNQSGETAFFRRGCVTHCRLGPGRGRPTRDGQHSPAVEAVADKGRRLGRKEDLHLTKEPKKDRSLSLLLTNRLRRRDPGVHDH